jgi:uncharacterized membrane protein
MHPSFDPKPHAGQTRLRRWLLQGGLAAAALTLAASAHAGYVFTTHDLAGASTSQGFGINNAGVMASSASVGDDTQGYLVTGGVATAFAGPAGALGFSALGISSGGVVVGSFYDTRVTDPTAGLVPGPERGYIRAADSSYTTFSVAGAAQTALRGISPNGRYLTGYFIDDTPERRWNSFVYDSVLGDLRTIVSGALITIAQGVDDNGRTVGNRITAPAGGSGPPVREAFVYDFGLDLADFTRIAGSIDTRLRAINASGQTAGWYRDAAGIRGFVGSTSSFVDVVVPGATATYVEGMNDLGWLSGIYADANDNFHAFIARPMDVPVPATLALALLGLALLGACRRR